MKDSKKFTQTHNVHICRALAIINKASSYLYYYYYYYLHWWLVSEESDKIDMCRHWVQSKRQDIEITKQITCLPHIQAERGKKRETELERAREREGVMDIPSWFTQKSITYHY